jgi:hypothetical protein
MIVMRQAARILLLLAPLLLHPAASDYQSASRKIKAISNNEVKPGSRVHLTPAEVNAWVAHEVAASGHEGISRPRVELMYRRAKGSALVDFARLRQARGAEPGWVMRQLLSGERPVEVTAKVEARASKMSIDIEAVSVSGVTLSGSALDFFLETFVAPAMPDARLGQPIELDHRIERLELEPSGVSVFIGD